MRQVTPTLPAPLASHYGSADVAKAVPFPVDSYRDLVRYVAHLAYPNPDHLLFFRGQATDYKNKAGASTFYPSIYRADPLPKREIANRFERLRFQGQQLARAFKKHGAVGSDQIETREILQWSIIQHYEIGETPLLDLTHSLAVACSFAQDAPEGDRAYVYVFGLPHISNRIAVNSEHDIINVRLLSICPPDALRPYFQEGYLVGTWDVTDAYNDKNVLDFNRRLMAKFSIPTEESFWGAGFGRVPQELLYPTQDRVKDLCSTLASDLEPDSGPRQIGLLLLAWQDVERILLSAAADRTERIANVYSAIESLREANAISRDLANGLNSLRTARNRIVHGREQISGVRMNQLLDTANKLAELLHDELKKRGNVT